MRLQGALERVAGGVGPSRGAASAHAPGHFPSTTSRYLGRRAGAGLYRTRRSDGAASPASGLPAVILRPCRRRRVRAPRKPPPPRCRPTQDRVGQPGRQRGTTAPARRQRRRAATRPAGGGGSRSTAARDPAAGVEDQVQDHAVRRRLGAPAAHAVFRALQHPAGGHRRSAGSLPQAAAPDRLDRPGRPHCGLGGLQGSVAPRSPMDPDAAPGPIGRRGAPSRAC